MRALVLLAFVASPAWADSPVIEKVQGRQSGTTWQFDVTLSHADTGWDDYADGWRVLNTDGTELGMRVLHHPHVNEQPFTRSLSGVTIPEGASEIDIQSRDSVGGWSDQTVTISLDEPNYAR